jgi:transcriptional regulator with XRE-family HTH domain
MPRPISTNSPKLKGVATSRPEICERFRKCRVDHQLSQAEFASLLEIGESLVKQIEYGKCAPTIDILRKIHKRFKLSYDYLIDGKKDDKTKE